MGKINLYRMRRLIREIGKLTVKIKREEAYATRTTGYLSHVPSGTDISKPVENGAVRIADLKEVYREVSDELSTMRKKLRILIDTLEDPDDRAVMRLRYLKGYRPEEISQMIYRTDRMVYYMLARSEKYLVQQHPDMIE